jgi:hypothetical protein
MLGPHPFVFLVFHPWEGPSMLGLMGTPHCVPKGVPKVFQRMANPPPPGFGWMEHLFVFLVFQKGVPPKPAPMLRLIGLEHLEHLEHRFGKPHP